MNIENSYATNFFQKELLKFSAVTERVRWVRLHRPGQKSCPF